MAKLTIIGNPSPVVGKKEMYTISTINDYFQQIIPTQPLLNPQTPIHWGIFVQEKNTWRKTTDNKEGQAVPYTFGQKSLHFKAIKIVAQQGNESGELIIHPQQSKEPKITKVELLDANYLPLPKGKKISYQDTIIARAHCIEMYKRNVSFTLWEDDAKGEGHNPVINMMNKINPVPSMGIVDEYGVAEAVFRLPMYTMAVQIANARIATGETDEGPTHEYYVTAEYVAKHIMKASPNVNVINPTYIPPAPPSKTIANIPETKPIKPKPKADTPKFPITSSGKKQADPDAKILNAEFLNERAQPIEKAEVGDTVIIKITTQHMKGRNVTVRIWEEETGYKTHDKIYEKKWVLPGNENFIKVPITKKIYELGITPEDMRNEKYDYKFQVYFIEVEPDNTHVTSQVIPITKSAKKLEVENSRSVAIIKKQREKEEKNECKRCSDPITIDLIKQIYPNCKDQKILDELTQTINKYRKVFKLDTCARKAHFFAQSIQEAGTNLKGALHGESLNYAAEDLPIQFKAFRKRNAKGEAIDKYGNPTKDEKKTMPNDLAYRYGRSAQNGYVANEKKIAEIAYGSRLGNKSIEDTWNFRGRGLLQITGRGTYGKIQQKIDAYASDSGVQIAEGQDKDYTSKEAAVTGMADWYKDNMYLEANKTGTLKDNDVVDLIVNIINTDTNSRPQRKGNYKKTKVIFEVDKCPKVKPQQNKDGKCSDSCSQCFEYADIWENPEISSDNHGKNNNRFGYNSARGHKGIDIVSGPAYKDVHSLMCGEVTAIVDTFKTNQYKFQSLGNTLMIKSKDKEGKTIFILYCHLNKIYVKKGDKVKHGQKVAQSGSTGNASSSEFPNGVKGSGINKKYWHCHIEAATKGDGYNNFRDLGVYRVKAEDYMKTKFDKNGNAIK